MTVEEDQAQETGESVALICATLRRPTWESPDLDCAVFTGDNASPQSLTSRALDRFGVKLLHPRQALCKFTPQFYFDTSGHTITYSLARIFGCKVTCYTNYTTISLDMVSLVFSSTAQCPIMMLQLLSVRQHSAIKVQSGVVWVGGIQCTSCNGKFLRTRSHIDCLWKIPQRTERVYPPVILHPFRCFLWKSQLGPQLEAFAHAVGILYQDMPRPKLQFVGSCWNKQDEERLQKPKDRCWELNLDNFVEFHRDVMYRDVVQLLGGPVAGLHSMIDEHFRISVVEHMASGVIPIAHNSAGPKMDIVLDEGGRQTGFLASNKEEYEAILQVIKMPEAERLAIDAAARKRAQRF
ncbi:Glycosyl transferases group 1 [Musa troglodytarum]|uniref:GDP-Man:Man(3)GlcNAc(2)-PP-Dol alpha-1,2-mannosyltransferase n=2 Tax=Musa troglodytarum TaxID=320322 RepID=A0A9E7I5G3_9LILI|nr:Glycosyl transferases group 1 [Musa troglodytarum]